MNTTFTFQDLQEIYSKVLEQVKNLTSEEELTELWRSYLGKTGELKSLMAKIKDLPTDQKRTCGNELNLLKNEIDALINKAKDNLKNSEEESYQNNEIFNEGFRAPKIGHNHPLTQTINKINKIFKRMGYSVYDGSEVETDEYVFQRTNLPEHHPARDLQDSIFIDELKGILLRTQTSSVEAHALEDLKPPFKIVIPGRAYRNEKVNRSNHFLFHQYQLVCVQEKVSMADLFGTISSFLKELYGEDQKIRFRTKYYPEVEPGAGVDIECPFCHGSGCVVCKKRGWIEAAGCGLIHPNMIKMAGLDPEKWQGFAFGFGLDRLAMTKNNIDDIRVLMGGNLAYKPN